MCWREEAQIFISDPTPKLTNEKAKNKTSEKKKRKKKVVKETKKDENRWRCLPGWFIVITEMKESHEFGLIDEGQSKDIFFKAMRYVNKMSTSYIYEVYERKGKRTTVRFRTSMYI